MPDCGPEQIRGPDDPGDRAGRQYPARPVVGVGAVVLVGTNVVLVQRRLEPLAGRWSLPGGALEVGETLAAGLAREILEETGLVAEVGPLIDVIDNIRYDQEGRVQYHYVLLDYLCRASAGEPRPGSDVAAVSLADPRRLEPFDLTARAQAVIARGLAMAKAASGPGPVR